MNKKKIIYDSMLNITASAIPIVILQLVLFPLLANKYGVEEYGVIITLVSLSTLISQPFGNVLNNIRLLENNLYSRENIKGDFNVLLLGSLLINSILMVMGTIYYGSESSFISIIFMVIISCLDLTRCYLIVTFRININYKAILKNNLILALGYLIGFIIFYIIGYWQIIYIFGSAMSLIYIFKNSNLWKEGFDITPLFKHTTYKSVILFLSVFISTLMSYADRLLLFPLLGSTAVSVYFTSTVIGKLLTRIITPINGVMLSYLAKMEKIDSRSFMYFIVSIMIVGVFGYVITILISEPLLHLLYPIWADESMQLVYITTATTIMGILSSVLHPIVLRFNNVNWQVIISITTLVLYISFAFIFFYYFGLLGFCIGILITTIIKFILLISIFLFNSPKNVITK
jgi:O-antigen/teichoic acid export membrane protein